MDKDKDEKMNDDVNFDSEWKMLRGIWSINRGGKLQNVSFYSKF